MAAYCFQELALFSSVTLSKIRSIIALFFFFKHVTNLTKMSFQVYLHNNQQNFKYWFQITCKLHFLVEYMSYIHYIWICIYRTESQSQLLSWIPPVHSLSSPLSRICANITYEHKLLYSCYYTVLQALISHMVFENKHSAESQKSPVFPSYTSVCSALNCSFDKERSPSTIRSLNSTGYVETLMRTRICRAGSAGLELSDNWVQK